MEAMKESVCDKRCGGCWFHESQNTCGFIFKMNIRRPCPAGAECREYLPKKEGEEILRKPKWDTEAGKKMWLEGKTDQQIAEALGTTKAAVQLYRCKKWVPTLAGEKKNKVPENGTEPKHKTTKCTEDTAPTIPEIAAPECATSCNGNKEGSSPSSAPAGHLPPGEGFALKKYQLLGRVNRSLGLIEGVMAGLGGRVTELVTEAVADIDAAVQELVGSTYG